MSTFAVRVHELHILAHPNADAIELARVGDYLSVVRKDLFHDGDLAAYIPEQAIVPVAILAELGLIGKLAGPAKNRVKAIKLRGILSEGLIYPSRAGWAIGQDVTLDLGITKHEPDIPTQMTGTLWAAGLDRTLRYDVENAKAYPDVFAPGDDVVATEKIHGTWIQIGLMPPHLSDPEHGDSVITSKGLAGRGLAFASRSAENSGNLYLRAARQHQVIERMRAVFAQEIERGDPVFVVGEVFGTGVQDLGYGRAANSDETLGLRIFDIFVGKPGRGRYLDDEELDQCNEALGVERTPVLYRGRFDKNVLLNLADGLESISGQSLHIREGIVVRATVERRDPLIGRAQLKMVSERYLLRNGGTEFQ